MSENTYFPANAFGAPVERSDIMVQWFSTFLSAMGEPSLWRASSTSKLHAYRFLWLRTFHEPVVARLQIEDQETGLLTAKMTDGAGGYGPGNLVVNETSRVSRRDVNEFLSRLVKLGFWQRPAMDESVGYADGAAWVLEGVQNREYHVVQSVSPEKGAFRETVLALLKLANLTVEPLY